jgi:hypothetical protein
VPPVVPLADGGVSAQPQCTEDFKAILYDAEVRILGLWPAKIYRVSGDNDAGLEWFLIMGGLCGLDTAGVEYCCKWKLWARAISSPRMHRLQSESTVRG